MRTESLMWLFPVVFMFHEFEEIIFLKPWLKRNFNTLSRRLPGFVIRMLNQTNRFSISAFTLIVAEEFILISLLVLIAVEKTDFALFVALVIAICLHNFVHLAQMIIIRKYIPVVLSSLVLLAYGIIIIFRLKPIAIAHEMRIIYTALMVMLGYSINFILMHKIAHLLDQKFFGRNHEESGE